MPEAQALPSTQVADELRRVIAARRRRVRSLKLIALAGLAALPALATILWKPPVLLVWNASASAPIGLYQVRPGAPVRRGDMVVAWTPDPARSLAARRHYLPANIPLVKRVVAAEGDQACVSGGAIRINGRAAAERLTHDPSGRPMPWWNGCRRLERGEYFLLMAGARSFDGRYFGPSRRSEIVGRARLLWAKPAKGSNDG